MDIITTIIMVLMTLGIAVTVPTYVNVVVPDICYDTVYVGNIKDSVSSYEQLMILHSFNNSIRIKNINNLTDKYNPVINVSNLPVWRFHNGIGSTGFILSEKRIKEDMC